MLARVDLLINPDTAVLHGTFYTEALKTATAALGVESSVANVYSPQDIEAAIGSLGKRAGGGLIVAPDTFSEVNGDLIVALAARHRVPAVYAISRFAKRGGLMSYGPNLADAVKRATTYVDRILRGEKPAELPVQEERAGAGSDHPRILSASRRRGDRMIAIFLHRMSLKLAHSVSRYRLRDKLRSHVS